MKLRVKWWECTDCDYETVHPSLAENHRNGQNHKLAVIHEEKEVIVESEPDE